MPTRTRAARPSADHRTYVRNMLTRFSCDYERRREADLLPPESVESAENGDLEPLQIDMVEFYAKDNAKEHRTDQFELVQDNPATPVLRRGKTFFLAVRFDRPFDSSDDTIKIIFDFGPKPSLSKGTKQLLMGSDKRELSNDNTKWDARIQHQDNNIVTLQVLIAATCQVGIWHCALETSRKVEKTKNKEFKCAEDIYILFNAWCKSDCVYLEHENERQEYVLNETGKVWMGSYQQPKGRKWIFGQFDDVVLPATMYLLELENERDGKLVIPHEDRGSPVHMARAISALINMNDDDGLLEGCWDGDYKDGTSPHAWTGSVAIMEQYLKSGGEPVKYGQCWVFSAAVVTVCRALGIPCRSITNYVSAHDTNRSLTVDKYFSKTGDELPGGPDGDCYDSCWNFHVWNDLWMSRPDLPPGYGGWQIIDATPQEMSEDSFRCGPASMAAVLKGEVSLPYDMPFVFAEVNADVCHFQESDKSDWGFTRLKMDQYHVGRKLVTKACDKNDNKGDTDMEDVTEHYKNPEGSYSERLAVFNAVRGVETAQKYYEFPKAGTEDVTFDLVEIDEVKFGEPFSVTVNLQNKSNKVRTITAILSASSVFYTGATVHRLKKAQAKFVVKPGQPETLRIHVSVMEYADKLVDHSLVKIYAMAYVNETNQTWTEEDDFPLVKPNLRVQVRGTPKIGEVCQATFSFQNPLHSPLTDCYFNVEGPGLQRPKVVKFRNVKADELVAFTEHFQPRKSGERTIMANFTSRQLTEVSGAATVIVEE